MTPNLDLEAWWRHHSRPLRSSRFSSCDLSWCHVAFTFDLLTPRLTVSRHCPVTLWTTCANLYQNQFIRFQNVVFTSLVTNKQSNKWINREHNASASQCELVEAELRWKWLVKELDRNVFRLYNNAKLWSHDNSMIMQVRHKLLVCNVSILAEIICKLEKLLSVLILTMCVCTPTP